MTWLVHTLRCHHNNNAMHAMTSGGVANAGAVCSLVNLMKGSIQVSLWEKILSLLVDGNLACNLF